MTCHDCIHKYCCKYDRFFGVDEVENKCYYFKNKADYVEVVRCHKCKNSIKLNGGYVCKIDNDMVFADHFCGYGERKDGKDINVPTK